MTGVTAAPGELAGFIRARMLADGVPGLSVAVVATPGCWCRDRVGCYPSDLTDAQWEVLRPEAETVMAELRRSTGRPMVHDLRAMVDAVSYVVRNGIEWRALPADFPPWEAVYAFFQRWSQRGLPQALVDRLRTRLRVRAGRDAQPSAAIVDSQSVKAADTVGAASLRRRSRTRSMTGTRETPAQ